MGYQCQPVRSNLYLLRKKLPAIEGIHLFGSQSATGYCQPQTVLEQEGDGIDFRHITGHNSCQGEQSFEHVNFFLHNRLETFVRSNCNHTGGIRIRLSVLGLALAGRQQSQQHQQA